MNYWIIAAIFLLDQLAKYWALKHLVHRTDSIVLIPGFLGLIYRPNMGAAYSILTGQTLLLTAVTLGAIILIGWMAYRTPREHRWMRWGYSLILGGAIGNLFDRMARGFVVDFMEFKFPGFFAQFGFVNNLADDAICVGMGCVLLALFLYTQPKETVKDSQEPGGTGVGNPRASEPKTEN